MLHGYRCKFRCGCRCRIGVVGLGLGTSNDSDRDDFDNPTIPDPMDTESGPNPTACNAPNDRVSTDAHPGSYHRSSTDQVQSYDPLSSPDLARRYDPCSSSKPCPESWHVFDTGWCTHLFTLCGQWSLREHGFWAIPFTCWLLLGLKSLQWRVDFLRIWLLTFLLFYIWFLSFWH